MRYLISFSYDGANFYGYQVQHNKRTIEEEIEKVLTKINSNKKVKISASGRTDRGVHALNQKAHFDFKEMNLDKFLLSINKLLPEDIFVHKIEVVDSEFHARFNVLKKEYVYKINMGDYNPIKRQYEYQLGLKLNVDKMIKASKYLIGTHNFKSVTKANGLNELEDYVRTIYAIDFKKDDDKLEIKFTGNGFMRYMVRNMVGLLLEVGLNHIDQKEVSNILLSEDRTKAFKTAPACGLYLNNVYY